MTIVDPVVRWYVSKGVDARSFDFVETLNVVSPTLSFTVEKEPAIVQSQIRRPDFRRLFKEYARTDCLRKFVRFDGTISHLYYYDYVNNFLYLSPLKYTERTMFTVCCDVPISIGDTKKYKTLREEIFPHPFFGGHFEGVNVFPFAKPVGINVFLIDEDGKLILQQRQNLGFDDGKISATAGGAVDWKKDLRESVYEELEEEIGIKQKNVEDLEIVGYVVNFKHLLDVSFVYTGYYKGSADDLKNEIEESEVKKLITIDVPHNDFDQIPQAWKRGREKLIKDEKVMESTIFLAFMSLVEL